MIFTVIAAVNFGPCVVWSPVIEFLNVSGYGNGMRKAISDWYLSKEPLDLADCVSQVRGSYGFTHRDLIKLCHLKSDDIGKSINLHITALFWLFFFANN